MRYAGGIQIDQIIVHIIPEQPGHLVLSQRALPLGNNPRLSKYFTDHIESSLHDPLARAARFVDLTGGVTAQACKGYFDGTLNLVAASQYLATHLHGIVTKDARISSGDLAVCSYRAANRPHVPSYLALLKIDPSEVLRHKTVQDDQGNVYVDFDFDTNVLPTARERLQKCAFVQPLVPRLDYDMMLLDRQTGPGTVDRVAHFFIDDFMGADPALDAQQRTKRFYMSAVSAQNVLRGDLTPAQDETLRAAIEQAVTSAEINVDAWIASLPLPELQKAEIDRVISENLPDREFEIDPTYSERSMRRRVFRGDHKLRVSVLADDYSQVIRSVTPETPPDAPPYYRVEIHTETWEEVVR